MPPLPLRTTYRGCRILIREVEGMKYTLLVSAIKAFDGRVYRSNLYMSTLLLATTHTDTLIETGVKIATERLINNLVEAFRMKLRSKVSSDGQITIPKAIRTIFDVKEGDIVQFELTQKGARISFVDTDPLSKADKEEINRLVAKINRGEKIETVEYQEGMYRGK